MCSADSFAGEGHLLRAETALSRVAGGKVALFPPGSPQRRARARARKRVPPDDQRQYVQSAIPFLELAWQGRVDS